MARPLPPPLLNGTAIEKINFFCGLLTLYVYVFSFLFNINPLLNHCGLVRLKYESKFTPKLSSFKKVPV